MRLFSAVPTSVPHFSIVLTCNIPHFFYSDISKKRMNPKVTIAVAFDSGITRGVVPIPIIAATSNFSDSKNILIGYGSSPTLRFEDIVSKTVHSQVSH